MTVEVKEDENNPESYIATLNADGTTSIQNLEPTAGEDVATSNYSALQAVKHALSQEPLEFENMVKIGLADRIQDTVEKRREEVAQSIFGVENPEIDTNNNDAIDDNEENKEVIQPEE